MNLSSIGIVILAAGASTRMGTPKQLLPYQGRNFIQHTVEIAVASICHPIIVVLGAYAEQIRQEVSHFPVQVVENLQWNEGMSSSIKVGINALNAFDENIEAVVLLLCDQPFLSAEIINQLVDTYRSTNKPIIASKYAETLGVPALFNRRFFTELTTLKQAEGAKKVMMKYSDEVFSISFPEGAIDVDTPQGYEQLISNL